MEKQKASIIIRYLIALLALLCIVILIVVPKKGKEGNSQYQDGGQEVNEQGDDFPGGQEGDGGLDVKPVVNRNDDMEKGTGPEVGGSGMGEAIALTGEDIDFLKQLCLNLPDFSSEEDMDAGFWFNCLYSIYTYDTDREIAALKNPFGYSKYLKVSSEEANRDIGLLFGKPLSEYLENPDGFENSNTKYQDGYYYIRPDGVTHFVYDSAIITMAADGKTELSLIRRPYYDKEPDGQIKLYLLPAENERGYILAGCETNWYMNLLRSIYGEWAVTGYIPPVGDCSLSQEELDRYTGVSLAYGEGGFRIGDREYATSQYERETISAGEFDAFFGMRSLEDLGISAMRFGRYELEVKGDAYLGSEPFGCHVYQIDYENALVFYGGVFFKISRTSGKLAPSEVLAVKQAVSRFYTLEDAEIPAEIREDDDFFCSTIIEGMEYAVLCYPEEGERLFLRRTEGADAWEATVLEDVSISCQYHSPFIAFNSKGNGMIAFGKEVTYTYVTNDGGTTWEIPPEVPELGRFYHEFILCMGAGGREGYFVLGYRYRGGSEKGNVFLTRDNGKTWGQVQVPIPEIKDLDFRYIEPIEIRQGEGKIIMKIHVLADDLEMRERGEYGARIAYYEVVSFDGGMAWELAEPGEELEFRSWE